MTEQKELSILIVDDEEHGRQNLVQAIQKHCPEISKIRVAIDAFEAKSLVEQETPDILFLDINMPKIDGFEFLESLSSRNFAIIFVTAYSEFSIRALKVGALDYLLKPISTDELKRAIERVINQKSIKIDSTKNLTKLLVPQLNGFIIINLNDIIRLEASDNYTVIYLINAQKILVSKSIGDFEHQLSQTDFYRIHKSHIINLAHIITYSQSDGGVVSLSEKNKVPVSKRKHREFIELIKIRTIHLSK